MNGFRQHQGGTRLCEISGKRRFDFVGTSSSSTGTHDSGVFLTHFVNIFQFLQLLCAARNAAAPGADRCVQRGLKKGRSLTLIPGSPQSSRS